MTNTAPIHFTIIRHGTTQNNLEGRFSGSGDYPLVREGIEFISDMIAKYPVDVPDKIYCSPSIRCVQTAKLWYPDRDFEILHDLREIAFGDVEDQHASIVWNNEYYRNGWKNQLPEFSFPNGERMGDCRDRGIRAMRRIIEESVKNRWTEISVITHSVIESMFLKALAKEGEFDRSAIAVNGMGVSLSIDSGDSGAERPFHFHGTLPKNAPVPDLSNSPYLPPRKTQ